MEKFVQTIHSQIFKNILSESSLNSTKNPVLSSSTFYFHVKKPMFDIKKVETLEFEILMSALLYPNEFSQTLNKNDR